MRSRSVLPAVSALMFDSAMLPPITARVVSTEVVVPPQVYVYGGPDSVQATEHLSITIWRPFVASESSSDVVGAVVVSVIEPTLLVPAEPLLLMSTARWIVSPGTRFNPAPLRPTAAAPRRAAAPVRIPRGAPPHRS